MASQNVYVVRAGEKYEKFIDDFSISKNLFLGLSCSGYSGGAAVS